MARELSGETFVDEKPAPHDEPRREVQGARHLFARFITGFLLTLLPLSSLYRATHVHSPIHDIQTCVSRHLKTRFLNDAIPITKSEFLERRNRLAIALHESGADAFVLEPGYTFQYYANISQTDWEPWEPEERPFLMIIRPVVINNSIKAHTMFLSPSFEVGRVRMLGIPSDSELDIVPWEEHWDPYATLYHRLNHHNLTLMIDEEMRDFISRGLQRTGFYTVGVSGAVEEVRQIKSPGEVELLRTVNTGTVHGVRALHKCLKPGLRERDLVTILDKAMDRIGFKKFFNIVLFDENAALPHGGFATGDKVLHRDTMVLIDVGYHYLGYSSDVCRSFFMPLEPTSSLQSIEKTVLSLWWKTSERGDLQRTDDAGTIAEKVKVWDIVFAAQTAAGLAFKPDNSCASVDLAARSVINEAGYNGTFTHRLGHGIGIKAHESPYLNEANTGISLKPGMVFTNEPGIYLQGKFGVRHEDIYLVKESGDAEILSGERARGPFNP